ncbi:hypothetical protein AAG906_005598 [Vitis piasezkii]
MSTFSFSSKSRGFKIGFKICHKNISEFPSLDEWIGKIDDSPNALIFESQANQDAILTSSTPVDSLPNMEGISTHLDIHDVKCSDSNPFWIAAMEEELSALNTNDT